jgi:hypothetical protein
MRLTFQKHYFLLALILLVVEILIAMYVNDSIIRPYAGDYLVVMLLYCLLKAFVNIPVGPAALAVLIFSYTIEILQYLNIVNWLGLQNYTLARVIIGTSFAWVDLLAYTLGVLTILAVETRRVANVII